MGPAGSGKSTIAVQYAVAAAKRGEHAAVFAFDGSIATLEARTEALGINFKECWEAGQVSVQQLNPAELSPGGRTKGIIISAARELTVLRIWARTDG